MDTPKLKHYILLYGLCGLIVTGICCQSCLSCDYLFKKYDVPEDNLLETFIEDVIEDNTGVDIDLSPSSPDNDTYLFEKG